MNIIRSFVRRLWPMLSVMGPAPAAPKKEPATLESGDRGMFDPDPSEAGDEGDPADGEGDPEAGDEGGDEDPQAEGDDGAGEDPDAEDARDTKAEDEEEEPEEDEDEDGDEDADEDGEDDPAAEDDASAALRASWEGRLEAAARDAGDTRPRLNIGRLALTENARKRFDELRAGDEDGKKDADAIFEVAMDACLQVLGSYHDDVAKPAGERVEKNLRNIQVGRRLAEFRKQVGAALTPKVEKRMAERYQAWAGKYGWRGVDEVPLTDLFRMAGGRLPKKGAKPSAGKKPAADPSDRAREQKRAALGAAAAGPRALGRTRPEGGGAAPKGKEDRALREFAQDVRGRTPFFTLGG